MMKRFLFFTAIQLLVLSGLSAQEKFNADTALTKMVWLGEKVSGQHTGTVKLQSGWITWKDNTIVSGEFNIDMGTIRESEGNARLEGHLKSDDFFSVAKYPVSKLVITGSSSFDKGTGVVTGTLTIKGITNPIEFKASLQRKDDGLWFYSNITVDRTIFDEFNLKVSLFVKK
jgi:polyisoprenoid-binding protein YceI